MKLFTTALALFLLLGLNPLFSQGSGNSSLKIDNSSMPQTKWTAEVLDEGPFQKNSTVTVRFTAELLDKDWHLYSAQESESFTYMPTEFYINPEETRDVELDGMMKDEMDPEEKMDEVMGGMIRFFNDEKISFTQTFKITGKRPVLVGEISGQLCKAPEKGGQCIRLLVPVKWTLPTP